MEIKSLYDRYSFGDISHKSGVSSVKTTESSVSERKTANALKADTISISSTASFQSTHAKEIKQYSAKLKSDLTVSSERLEALKAAYSGDKCPVSSLDIANAMIDKLL